MTLQAFYELAFLTGAFQAEAETEEWAFQQCVFQSDAFQADACDPVEVSTFKGWILEKPAKDERQFKKKNDKRRKDIEEAYALLIEHPEPSIVREVREIVGTAQLDTLAQPKITQLLTLAREVEEEEELLLLLL